jgi:hypothetical protein
MSFSELPAGHQEAVVKCIIACLNTGESVVPGDVANPRLIGRWVGEWLRQHGQDENVIHVEQRAGEAVLQRQPIASDW